MALEVFAARVVPVRGAVVGDGPTAAGRVDVPVAFAFAATFFSELVGGAHAVVAPFRVLANGGGVAGVHPVAGAGVGALVRVVDGDDDVVARVGERACRKGIHMWESQDGKLRRWRGDIFS